MAQILRTLVNKPDELISSLEYNMVKERTYSFGLSTDIDTHYKIEAPYITPSTHSLNNSINIIKKGMEHDRKEKEAEML